METGIYEVRKHGQAMSRIENEVWAARKTSSQFEFVFRAAHTSFSMGRTPPRNPNQEGSSAVLDQIQSEQNLPDSDSWLLRVSHLQNHHPRADGRSAPSSSSHVTIHAFVGNSSVSASGCCRLARRSRSRIFPVTLQSSGESPSLSVGGVFSSS